MDSIFVFITIIIAIILLVLIVNRNDEKPNNNRYIKNNLPTNKNNHNNDLVEGYDAKIIKENSYSLVGNEDEYQKNVEGYENELILDNNLKTGDYVNQFQEIDFSKFPKSNIQVGFNPQPRESTETKLPFADINVNCL